MRPAPVPSALFEPPTADDIDKALEALAETSGTHVPPPISPTSDVQPTPLADPSAEAPRFVSDDASNEPTRVVDVVEELVGGTAAHPPALSDSAPDHPATASDDGNVETGKHTRSEASPRAASLDAPIELQLQDVEPAQPLPPEPRVRKAGPVPKSGGVEQAVAPEKSTRFRAASSAYPTLKRRRLTVLGVTVIVVGSVAIIGVLKLHWKERLFPPAPPTAPAAVVEAPPPAAAAPAAVNPAPSTAAAAPEGAGGGTEAKGEIAAPAPAQAPTPSKGEAPPKVEAPPQEKSAPGITGKAASGGPAEGEEHASTKHAAVRRRAHEAPAGSSPAESKAPGEKSAEKAPAKATDKAPAKATEKADDEKAATDKSAGTAAAPPPTEAAPPAPPAPVLKVTSTPAGAEVIIDGSSVGTTPFTSKTIDPAAPHAITVKKDGFEPTERMIGGLDWSRPHGNSPASLKVNVKLHR
ncbi:MAG TPA: PEGA domain-containing protein, partial [Polyangia bacterium]|nr:PEGA domain-containing protein [Polyangia bacterium]